jgi:hypothetical protein
MRDKQKSAYELMARFPDGQSVLTYLTDILWLEEPGCPFCDSKNHNVRTD